MVKHKYIQANIEILRNLVRSGDIKAKVLAQFKMYLHFDSQGADSPRMQRYENTAEEMGCGIRIVMDAVKSMELEMDLQENVQTS